MSDAVDATSKSQKQQLTRQERNKLQEKRKELILVEKRLKCLSEVKIKVILVGNSGVGKTSLIQKFVNDKADIRQTQVTMLCDFHHCMVPLTGKNVNIRMWDTGGMERFHENNLTASFYRNTDGVMMVFSVEDHDSFVALPRWLARAKENIGPQNRFDCCLVGNKSDRSENRVVSRLEAERYAYQLGFPYIETSALDVVNVHKAFTDLSLAVIKRYEITQQVLSSTSPEPKKTFKLTRQRSNGGDSWSCGCH